MKYLAKRAMFLALAFVAGSGLVFAQPIYHVIPSSSSLVISGTSSMHDWTMEAEDFEGYFTAEYSENGEVVDIRNVRFSVPVEEIKSESNLMDKKAYDALRENKAPSITFEQQSLQNLQYTNGTLTGRLTGRLTVAGQSKQVQVSFRGKVMANNKIQVTGTLPLKMSDFGVDPPTAMLGALKTGDAVTLNYTFEFDPDLTSSK